MPVSSTSIPNSMGALFAECYQSLQKLQKESRATVACWFIIRIIVLKKRDTFPPRHPNGMGGSPAPTYPKYTPMLFDRAVEPVLPGNRCTIK